MQEKVEHLRASFPSINPEEVMNALRDENGRPDRAAALLQLYVQEDAQVAPRSVKRSMPPGSSKEVPSCVS